MNSHATFKVLPPEIVEAVLASKPRLDAEIKDDLLKIANGVEQDNKTCFVNAKEINDER